jgi:hypothetical protein
MQSDDKGIAYKKLVAFLRDYKNSDKALFELGFIDSISGYDDMKFRVSFKVK